MDITDIGITPYMYLPRDSKRDIMNIKQRKIKSELTSYLLKVDKINVSFEIWGV